MSICAKRKIEWIPASHEVQSEQAEFLKMPDFVNFSLKNCARRDGIVLRRHSLIDSQQRGGLNSG